MACPYGLRDAGRISVFGYDCSEHRGEDGTDRQGTAGACGGSGEHPDLHRVVATGLQHEDRYGGQRGESGTTPEAVDCTGGVQESGVHLLRRGDKRAGREQRKGDHGTPATILRRTNGGCSGTSAKYGA